MTATTERQPGRTRSQVAGLLSRARPGEWSVYVTHTNALARFVLLYMQEMEEKAGRTVSVLRTRNSLRLQNGAMVLVTTAAAEWLRGRRVFEVVYDHAAREKGWTR